MVLESSRKPVRRLALCGMLAAALGAPCSAQTIQGSLIDVDSNAPIPLGLVLMYTEAGDSVASTISDGAGQFMISSPEPGSFLLTAAALGYAETPAGVFELGDGGSMTIEYRLRPAPLPIDALLVAVDRPALDHHLVRNGFVRRLQRGLGRFITPHDIEQSTAISTEGLMQGIPSVRIGPVSRNLGGAVLPTDHIGETVQIVGPLGGWCQPTIYVDGSRVHYDPWSGFTLSEFVSRQDVEAIEVYRRAAEIPVEFGVADQGSGTRGCGVLVLWSKRGPGVRQRAQADPVFELDPEAVALPSAESTERPVEAGERIRLAISADAAEQSGLDRVWQGTYVTTSAGAAVVEDPATGRPVSIPVASIEAIQVSRLKPGSDAIKRGARSGMLFGLGVWGFLELLCRYTCGESADPQQTLLPAVGAGTFVGVLVGMQGPGTEWVSAPLPGGGGVPTPGGLSLSWSVPAGRR